MRELMRTRITFANADEPLYAAQQKILTGRIRAVPVVNAESQLIGLLTADDVNETYRLMAVSPILAVNAR